MVLLEIYNSSIFRVELDLKYFMNDNWKNESFGSITGYDAFTFVM